MMIFRAWSCVPPTVPAASTRHPAPVVKANRASNALVPYSFSTRMTEYFPVTEQERLERNLR